MTTQPPTTGDSQKCNECGGLYGAHARFCQQFNPRAAAQMWQVCTCKPYDDDATCPVHHPDTVLFTTTEGSEPTTEKASETPRADARAFALSLQDGVLWEDMTGDNYVESNFARALERELTAALEKAAEQGRYAVEMFDALGRERIKNVRLQEELTAAQRQIEELLNEIEGCLKLCPHTIRFQGRDMGDSARASLAITMAGMTKSLQEQAAEAERLRRALERLIQAVSGQPLPFDIVVEIDIAQKELSAAPAGERVVSKDGLEKLLAELDQSVERERRKRFGGYNIVKKTALRDGRVEAFQEVQGWLRGEIEARTAPRSGEVAG